MVFNNVWTIMVLTTYSQSIDELKSFLSIIPISKTFGCKLFILLFRLRRYTDASIENIVIGFKNEC